MIWNTLHGSKIQVNQQKYIDFCKITLCYILKVTTGVVSFTQQEINDDVLFIQILFSLNTGDTEHRLLLLLSLSLPMDLIYT